MLWITTSHNILVLKQEMWLIPEVFVRLYHCDAVSRFKWWNWHMNKNHRTYVGVEREIGTGHCWTLWIIDLVCYSVYVSERQSEHITNVLFPKARHLWNDSIKQLGEIITEMGSQRYHSKTYRITLEISYVSCKINNLVSLELRWVTQWYLIEKI